MSVKKDRFNKRKHRNAKRRGWWDRMWNQDKIPHAERLVQNRKCRARCSQALRSGTEFPEWGRDNMMWTLS